MDAGSVPMTRTLGPRGATKLDKLHGEYAESGVHARPQMLSGVYPGIGPHKNASSTVTGLYLLR